MEENENESITELVKLLEQISENNKPNYHFNGEIVEVETVILPRDFRKEIIKILLGKEEIKKIL